MSAPADKIRALIEEISACRLCEKHLAAGPRPVVRFSAASRILIIGQAPGARVHETGIPWNDASGERLRSWTGLGPDVFYDTNIVALVPMGFCYPGTGTSGDLPPRPECAPQWHEKVLSTLPTPRLTLLVGGFAQKYYLKDARRKTLTEIVRAFDGFGPDLFPLPHPSWRSTIWMRRNPWFEAEVVGALQERIRTALIPSPADSAAPRP